MNARLLRAYRSSQYEAAGIPVFIGRLSPAMDALLNRHGARVGVFVTAWNPKSRLMPAGWNACMQRALLERLRRIPMLQAEGSWRDWREAHVLALADPAVVRCIARSFRQAAVVVVRAGRKARLFAIK